VKTDVEKRLAKSGIDILETHIWTLRGPETRIEKRRPPPSAGKPSWSRGRVRDVNVDLIEALALASWLRSGTTTHRFSEIYDAHNVQSLARHLIMDKFGFWQARTKPPLPKLPPQASQAPQRACATWSGAFGAQCARAMTRRPRRAGGWGCRERIPSRAPSPLRSRPPAGAPVRALDVLSGGVFSISLVISESASTVPTWISALIALTMFRG
jgi:hypothetical protein